MNSTLVSDAREVANRLVRVLGFALHLAAPCVNKRLNLGRLDLARALWVDVCEAGTGTALILFQSKAQVSLTHFALESTGARLVRIGHIGLVILVATLTQALCLGVRLTYNPCHSHFATRRTGDSWCALEWRVYNTLDTRHRWTMSRGHHRPQFVYTRYRRQCDSYLSEVGPKIKSEFLLKRRVFDLFFSWWCYEYRRLSWVRKMTNTGENIYISG